MHACMHAYMHVCLVCVACYLELAGPRKLAVKLDALVDLGVRDVVNVVRAVVDHLITVNQPIQPVNPMKAAGRMHNISWVLRSGVGGELWRVWGRGWARVMVFGTLNILANLKATAVRSRI